MKIGITAYRGVSDGYAATAGIYVESSAFETPAECLAEIGQTVMAIDRHAYMVLDDAVNYVGGGDRDQAIEDAKYGIALIDTEIQKERERLAKPNRIGSSRLPELGAKRDRLETILKFQFVEEEP